MSVAELHVALPLPSFLHGSLKFWLHHSNLYSSIQSSGARPKFYFCITGYLKMFSYDPITKIGLNTNLIKTNYYVLKII